MSNKDLQSRVSSIGATNSIEPTEDEQRRDADNKLSEFLGNLPPVAVLPSMKNLQKENEDNWCCLGESKTTMFFVEKIFKKCFKISRRSPKLSEKAPH